MPIAFFPFFILFILYMLIKLFSSDKKHENSSRAFWSKEQEANHTRRQSLDSVPYITIPLESLPFMEQASPTILDCQQRIRNLAQQPIANFTGISNTDLKLQYGAANLDKLSAMDQNFTELTRQLYKWGQALYDENHIDEAISVLEYGIACKTDISKHYTLLAEIYKQKNAPDKISCLIETAETLEGLMKAATLRSLNEVAASCQPVDEY